MVINLSAQYNNGGFLPDVILLTLCDYMKSFVPPTKVFPSKSFDNFSLRGWMLRRSGWVQK